MNRIEYYREYNKKNREKKIKSCRKWYETKGMLLHKSTYIPKKIPTDQRFWLFVVKESPENCWNWIGAKTPGGYGRFLKVYAHRFAYELVKGEISKGMCICHSCDNPSCVNPKHLWMGSISENMKDRDMKGRGRGKKKK